MGLPARRSNGVYFSERLLCVAFFCNDFSRFPPIRFKKKNLKAEKCGTKKLNANEKLDI